MAKTSKGQIFKFFILQFLVEYDSIQMGSSIYIEGAVTYSLQNWCARPK